MRCHLQSSECQGRLEWHHAVSKNRIKRQFKYGAYRFDENGAWAGARYFAPISTSHDFQRTLDDILGDTRNRIWVCQFHHERITNGRVKVELPPSVWEFCRDFGLVGMLENDLRRAA